MVFLAVHDSFACAHDLDVTFANDRGIPHAVSMFQTARQRDAYNLHVLVWMRAKTSIPANGIVIQYSQGTEVHALWIVPACEAEAVVGVEPSMICMAT